MAYPDDVDVADDPLLPKSVPIEKATGQARGGITGLNSVVPFRAAGWSDQYPDGTQKTSLWNPDAPTPSIERLKNKIGSLWNGGSQGIMDSIQRGADKALGAVPGDTGGAAAPLGITDPESPVGGEAAPLGVTSPPAGRALEKFADVLDTKNPPTKAPEGSLLDKITGQPRDLDSGPTPPSAISPGTDRTAAGSESADIPPKAEPTQQQGPRAGLFGVPGLLGEFGANVHNWTDQRRMQLLALAGGLAGAPSLGQGFGRGFTAAANAMPEQTKLNTQNATVNYLMNKGNMSHDEAMAVMGNPALAHDIMGQISGVLPPKTITSQIGQGQFQWVPGKGWQSMMGGGDIGSTNAGNAAFGNMSVPERLAHIEKMYPGTGTAEAVKAIGEYRDVAPNRLAALMPLAQKVYGEGLDRKVYDQARKTIMDFSPNGISGKNITAIGTGIGHANDMVNYADNLKNFTIGDTYSNTPYNAVRKFFNIDDFQRKVANFKATALGTSGEMAKAFRSAGMSENDIQGWLKMFSENSSPETIHGAAQAAMHMLNVRLDEIARSYNQAMPPNAQQKTGESFLTPNNIAVRNRIMGGPQTQTPPQTQGAAGTSGKPPIIIQNGHTYHLQPDGRYQ